MNPYLATCNWFLLVQFLSRGKSSRNTVDFSQRKLSDYGWCILSGYTKHIPSIHWGNKKKGAHSKRLYGSIAVYISIMGNLVLAYPVASYRLIGTRFKLEQPSVKMAYFIYMKSIYDENHRWLACFFGLKR
ncbi:hypothetical protein BDA99DRAFT_535852 [Phascolomyces articulosus]|uniref:Uncharacterized protein n=1 Tax=Phascolomyces articulosus TaxID=60185 RepID=A0AAD5PFZ1_9FUNG|nr:hypothetical protein BDA99DRAFT_535852 [Phascolomyces articulosus]